MMVLVSGGGRGDGYKIFLWMRQIRSKVTTIYVHGE